jgi:hypothetical protein
MGMFEKFFGKAESASSKEDASSEEQTERIAAALREKPAPDWRGSKVTLELLARFFRGADPWSFIGKEHWNDVLGEKVEKVIERLQRAGALVKAPDELTLTLRYSVEDLRFMLRERGGDENGSLEQLVRRLFSLDPAGGAAMAAEINILILSDEARRHVVKYVRAERERREVAERKCLVGLLQKDFLRAALAVGEYQKDSVFSRGVGVSFHDDDHLENGQILQAMFEKVPAMLAAVDHALLEALRPAAGMAFLWGKESARPWIAQDLVNGSPYDAEIICAMLDTHARYLCDLDRFRKTKYDKFEIWSRNDALTCPSCRALRGELYSLESLPELPHEHCSAARGCRCSVVVSEHAF